MADPGFEEFTNWLVGHRLLRKFYTQLRHALPPGSNLAGQDQAAKRTGEEFLSRSAHVLELSETLRRVRTSAIGASCHRLAELAPALTACLAANRRPWTDAASHLPRSESLRRPDQTLHAAISGLGRGIDLLGNFATSWSAFELSGLADLIDLATLEEAIVLIQKELKEARDRFAKLQDHCVGFAFPTDLRQLLDLALRACTASSAFVDACKLVERGATPDSLERLSESITEAGLDARLATDVDALRAKLEVGGHYEGEQRLLFDAWNRSNQAYLFASSHGLHVPSCFLATFARGAVVSPSAKADQWHWFMQHASEPDTVATTSGRDIIVMALSCCCTLYRWAKDAGMLHRAEALIAMLFLHSQAKETRTYIVPADWVEIGRFEKKNVWLIGLHNLTGAITSGKSTKPRLAHFLDRAIPASTLKSIRSIVDRLATVLPIVWPVALASKLAFFHVPVLRDRCEPTATSKPELREAVVSRIGQVADFVNPAESRQLTIERLACLIFDNAPADEVFTVREIGLGRSGTLPYGYAAMMAVEEAVSACRAEEALDDVMLLFCKPLRANKKDQVWQVRQVLVDLMHGLDTFRLTLWLPLAGRRGDAEREKGMEAYFRAAAG